MKPLYKSDVVSSYWCQSDSLLYHKVHRIPIDDDELERLQNKLSEIYVHLNANDIEFTQIYHPNDDVCFKLENTSIITKFAYFLKSQDTVIDEYCKGVSVIHDNGYASSMINYLITLLQNKIPVKIVKDESAAYEFLDLKKINDN